MHIKMHNGKAYGVQFTAREREAMHKEVNRQLVEQMGELGTDVDALILWVLHVEFGFGKQRLKRFFDVFTKEYEYMGEYYDMPKDVPWICRTKLKEIGVDIEQWNKEAKQ